jgi:hypothetical protein
MHAVPQIPSRHWRTPLSHSAWQRHRVKPRKFATLKTYADEGARLAGASETVTAGVGVAGRSIVECA